MKALLAHKGRGQVVETQAPASCSQNLNPAWRHDGQARAMGGGNPAWRWLLRRARRSRDLEGRSETQRDPWQKTAWESPSCFLSRRP